MQSTALVKELCSTMRNTVQASVTRQQSTTCTVLAKLEEQNLAIQKMQETQQAMLLLMQQQNHQQQHHDRSLAMEPIQQSIVDDGVGAGDGAGNVARRYQEEVKTEEDDKKQPPSDATAHARHAQDLCLNQVTMLRHTPRSPVISEKFPLNWPALESEWRINKLDSFVNMKSKLWDDGKLTQRFAKRHRGIKMLRKFRKEHHYFDDAEAAGKLEQVRDVVKKSLSAHMADLFNNCNDITRRVRTRKSRPDNK